MKCTKIFSQICTRTVCDRTYAILHGEIFLAVKFIKVRKTDKKVSEIVVDRLRSFR